MPRPCEPAGHDRSGGLWITYRVRIRPGSADVPEGRMNAPYMLLGFVVLPVWIAAGFADYLCHRATQISRTSGVAESILHLAQFALVGIPLTLALFLKATAGLFLLA